MKPRHAATVAAILGLLIPVTCEAVNYVHPYMAGEWLLWIWPSSLQLLVLGGRRDPWPDVAMVLGISIGINMILYAGIGWVIAFIYSRVLGRFRTPSP